MKVRIDYPVNKSFQVRGLKLGKGGTKKRTEKLQRLLSKTNYKAPHMPSDFIVEAIEVDGESEFWIVGS